MVNAMNCLVPAKIIIVLSLHSELLVDLQDGTRQFYVGL